MNKRGMTLLEIVISLGILVIIVTSLTKVFTSGVSLTMESDSLSRSELKVRKAIAGEKIAGVKITAPGFVADLLAGWTKLFHSGTNEDVFRCQGPG